MSRSGFAFSAMSLVSSANVCDVCAYSAVSALRLAFSGMVHAHLVWSSMYVSCRPILRMRWLAFGCLRMWFWVSMCLFVCMRGFAAHRRNSICQTESFSIRAEYVTVRAEYVMAQAERVTEKAESVIRKAERVTNKAERVTEKAESVTAKAESRHCTNRIFRTARSPRRQSRTRQRSEQGKQNLQKWV